MIWPFKSKPVEKPKLHPYEDFLNFHDNGIKYKYIPQEDITPYEVALLWPLCYGPWVRNADIFGYIRKHNLMRHFTTVEK